MPMQRKQSADAIVTTASSYLFAEHKGKYKQKRGANVVKQDLPYVAACGAYNVFRHL